MLAEGVTRRAAFLGGRGGFSYANRLYALNVLAEALMDAIDQPIRCNVKNLQNNVMTLL